MFQRRILFIAVLIASASLAMVADEPGVGDVVAFVSPENRLPVIGLTEFQFAVVGGRGVHRIDVYVEGRLVGSARPPEWTFVWEAPSGLVDVPIVAAVFSESGLVETVRIHTSEASFGDLIQVVEVQLFPVVTDRKGRYVRGLSVEDFSVYDRGKRVDLKSFSIVPPPLNLAIVIDNSNSMLDKLGLVREASSQFVDRLSPGDRVSVYSFNHSVRKIIEMSGDHRAVKASIRAMRAVGGTALYDALVQVSSDMKSIRGRKAVVLFSDGQDERSITSLERAVEQARRGEVIVYAVGVGESKGDLVARGDLQLLSDETGGQAHFIDRVRQLAGIYDAILIDLQAQYSLSFIPEPAEMGERVLSVNTKDPALTVRCRKSYYHPGE